MSFSSIEEIKRANNAAGEHWFSADTMRFFNSRVGSRVWPHTEHGGAYFISSEQRETHPYTDMSGQLQSATERRYTIREARPDGSIETVGEFMGFTTRADAVRALEHLLSI